MAVYTSLNHEELSQLIANYSLGTLKSFEPIDEGLQNTNYRVATSTGHTVLTIFEEQVIKDDSIYDYVSSILNHAHSGGLPVPQLLENNQGQLLSQIKGKLCWFAAMLPGKVPYQVTPAMTEEAGAALARFHLHCADFPQKRSNPRNTTFHYNIYMELKEEYLIKEPFLTLAEKGWAYRHLLQNHKIPTGLIHGDYFRDNTLFQNGVLTGILDLFFAVQDAWVVDLAMATNDWGSGQDGTLNIDAFKGLIQGYEQHRKLTAIEREVLPAICALKALETWSFRVFLKERYGEEVVRVKTPEAYWKVYTARQAEGSHIQEIFAGLTSP